MLNPPERTLPLLLIYYRILPLSLCCQRVFIFHTRCSPQNAPRLVMLLLLWGACWRNSRGLLASSTAQNGSFYNFTSFSVKKGNYLLILSGIWYEWWNLLPHWCELLSHQCLNPSEQKLISIPVPPTRSCIRRTTFHPAWDLSHFLLLTLHPPLHT